MTRRIKVGSRVEIHAGIVNSRDGESYSVTVLTGPEAGGTYPVMPRSSIKPESDEDLEPAELTPSEKAEQISLALAIEANTLSTTNCNASDAVLKYMKCADEESLVRLYDLVMAS